jgi:hypothetical protein
MTKLSCFLAMAALFLSLTTHAQQARYREPLHVLEQERIVSNGLFKNKVTGYTELEQAYQAGAFHDYAGFLDLLLSKSPRLRDRVVLVHRSESQQLSSLEHPRVLLYDGGTIFALSEHPDQKNQRVEILETQPGTYDVQLREIVFKEDRSIQFSANPKSCIACHGIPAKPLWNPYDFWPNAYTSAIGQIGTQQEKIAYQKLKAGASSSPLLKRLTLPQEMNFDTENITGFTQNILQINLGRWISQNLSAKSSFDRGYALPLLASLNYCTAKSRMPQSGTVLPDFGAANLKTYLRPEEVFPLSPSIETIGADVLGNRNAFKSFLDQIQNEIYPQATVTNKVDHDRLINEVEVLSQMQWLLSLAGVDAANMTTSLYANDYLISAPSNYPFDFMTTLYELRPDLFVGLKLQSFDMSTGQDSWIKVDCDSILEESLKETRPANPLTWKPSSEVSRSVPVVNRCAKCHVQDVADKEGLAPRIPFHRVLDFSTLLKDPREKLKEKIMARVRATDDKQMPPGTPLTAEEIAGLEEYLNNLTN